MINFLLIGLFLIMVAWVIQAYRIWMGKKDINKIFVILYLCGVILLVIQDLIAGNVLSAIFQFGSLLSAILVLLAVA